MVKGKQMKAPSGRWWPPVVVSLILLGGVALWTRDSPVFVDSSYWNMAVSLVRDGDLFLLDGEPKMTLTEFHLTTQGHLANPHFAGSALIAYPFLALGQALMPVFHPEIKFEWNASGGYGPTDHYRLSWYNASVLTCGLFLLLLMYSLCRKFTAPLLSAIAVIAVLFSTQLWRMLWFTQGGSEIVAVLLVTILIGTVTALHSARSLPPLWGLPIGLLLGLATLVRLQSVIWAAFPVLVMLVWWRKGRLVRKEVLVACAGGSVGFLLAVLPQFLIYRTWFGTFFPDPYGASTAREHFAEIIQLIPDQPGFLTISAVPLLGLAGLFFFPRRLRSLTAGFWVVIAGTLLMAVFRRGHIESELYLSSRYCLSLAPIFALGLAALLNRLPRRFRLLFIVLIGVLTYVEFVKMFLPMIIVPGFEFPPELENGLKRVTLSAGFLSSACSAFKAAPLIGPALFYMLGGGPKFTPSWWLLGGLSPFFLVGAWLYIRWRRAAAAGKERWVWVVATAVLLVAVIFNLSLVSRAAKRSEGIVNRKEREGFFNSRWRTLEFDWANTVDDLQLRSMLYLKNGQYGEAVRLGLVAAAIKPIREGGVPDWLERLRKHPEIGLSLWQELYNHHAVAGAVKGVTGLNDAGFARDGNIVSITPLLLETDRAGEVTITLDRSENLFSDVVVVFSSEKSLENIRAEVSADGTNWQKPCSVERWPELLWIWDFYQRPWRYLRLSGFESPEEISVREIFAIFSPRHSR